jgi:copper chaperone CopZ
MLQHVDSRLACGFAAALVIASGLACQGAGGRAASTFPADSPTLKMRVNGLSCPLCAHNIDQQLMHIPGVKSVFVDLGKGEVTVAVSDENPPDRERLSKAIADSGFSLVEIKSGVGLTATVCNACECRNCSCVAADPRCLSACHCG